jgi:hypothetical protein
MRKGHLRLLRSSSVVLLLMCACAKGGKQMPAAEVDASEQTNPDPIVDARPDATPPDAPPDACVPVTTEYLMNPVFDLPPDGVNWTAVRNPQLYPIIGPNPTGLMPISAPNKAWFGGAAGNDLSMTAVTDSLYQDVTFPANATTFVVSGFYLVAGIEDTDAVYDTFTLDVIETNGTPIENVMTLNNMQNTGAQTFATFSKPLTSNLAGRTVRLRGTSTNDIIQHTNFFFDSMSFKATHCP